MIKTQSLIINGKSFIKTYSDSHRYVVREGISYSEAVDPAEFNRQYTEGDIIEDPDNDYAAQQAQEILDILLEGEE